MLVRLCAASLALSLGAASLAASLSAQQVPSQLPSPEQAQQLLESRPDLVAQLRQRLQASGMTADQIRARLRAEGYPENLLDAYLGTGTTGTSPSDSVPNAGVFDAVQALGIVDSAGLDSLRNMQSDMFRNQQQQIRAAVRDEVVCDSVIVDSVPAATPQQQGDSAWIDSMQKSQVQQQRRRPISQLLCRPRRLMTRAVSVSAS